MKWISVKDRLPEIDYKKKETHKKVLGWDGKKIYVLSYGEIFRYNENIKPVKTGYHFNTYCRLCNDAEIINITHWMPLPKVPEEG